MAEKDYGEKAAWINEKDPSIFNDMFPSETRGNGQIIKNNERTGAAQGKESFKRKVRCQICGFPMDIQKVDHSGGSLDGDGAGGNVDVTVETALNSQGDTWSENVPDQDYKKAAGCPLCFSKHGSKIVVKGQTNIEPRPKIGF